MRTGALSTSPDVLHQMKHLKWCRTMSAGVDAFVKSGIFDSGEVILTNCSGQSGDVNITLKAAGQGAD